MSEVYDFTPEMPFLDFENSLLGVEEDVYRTAKKRERFGHRLRNFNLLLLLPETLTASASAYFNHSSGAVSAGISLVIISGSAGIAGEITRRAYRDLAEITADNASEISSMHNVIPPAWVLGKESYIVQASSHTATAEAAEPALRRIC